MRGALALGLGLCLALTGCAALPYAHEIDQTVLMEALGVDAGAEGAVVLTAASAGRAGTEGSAPEAPLVLTAQAETVAAACARVQGWGERYVFFGDVEQVLVGEALAREGLEDLLGHMARDPYLRLEAGLWVVKGGTAADPLFDAAQAGGAPGRLTALEQDAELLGGPLAKTAREALADLLDGGSTLLPALERRPAGEGQGAEGDHLLAPAGYALLREGALLAFTQGEETLGATLLLGHGHGGLLTFPLPGGAAAVRLTGVEVEVSPVFSGEVLTGAALTCRLEAQAAEHQGSGGGLPEETRRALEERLAERAEGALRAALDLCQGLGADGLRLGPRCALAAPWRRDALEEQWAAAFPELELTLEVEALVARD